MPRRCRSAISRSTSWCRGCRSTRQRPAGRAGADPARAEAGRAAARRPARRRYADRAQERVPGGGGGGRGRREPARCPVRRRGRSRRAAAAGEVRAAGGGCRPDHRHLSGRAGADARAEGHGGSERARGAPPRAAAPAHPAARRRDLPGALRAARRPGARHLRDRHAHGLGAAREPAAAAAAGHGQGAAGGCAGNDRAAGRRYGEAVPLPRRR